MIGPGSELTTGERRSHLQLIVPMTLVFYMHNPARRPLFPNCEQLCFSTNGALDTFLPIGWTFWIDRESSTAASCMGRLDGAGCALARGIHHPCHSHADGIQCDHGSGKQAHVQDVSRGCDNCRHNENDKD